LTKTKRHSSQSRRSQNWIATRHTKKLPVVSGCQKTPPNKSPSLSPPIEINAETSKAKPKAEFWRATETNRLTRQAYKKAMPTAEAEAKQTGQRQKPNCE